MVQIVNRRPSPVFFFSLGVMALCPLFSCALFTLKKFRQEILEAWHGRPAGSTLFFWTWILVFYILATQPWHVLTVGFNQEHRYFYLAYPPIALLSALVLDRFRQKNRFRLRAGIGWGCNRSSPFGLERSNRRLEGDERYFFEQYAV